MSADKKESNENLEWSSTSLKNIALEEYFPSAVKDLSVQKGIITRFLNFYLGGKVEKGLGVEDVVFAVLSVLPHSPYNEEVIWSSGIYKDNGKAFFLTPVEKLASDVKAATSESHNVQSTTQKAKKPLEQSLADNGDDAPNDINNFDINTFHEVDDIFNDDIAMQVQTELDEPEVDNEHSYDYESTENTSINEVDKNDPISKQPDHKFYTKPQNFIKDFPKNIKFPFDYTSKPIQSENKILNYGPVENAAFITCCHKLLSRWDKDTQSRSVLKSFFAIVAFVLMRATTKGYKHLISSFHGEKFLRLLRHSSQCGLNSYSPPHKRCLKRSYRTFSRRDGKTPTMFAKLVYIVSFDSLKPKKYLKYVILNGLLNYTADYGFNLIRLLFTVCSNIKFGSVTLVMELTLCEETEASWKKVAAFLTEYCSGSSSNEFNLLSYRWARVLDSRFFKEVSCQRNFGLAVVLAVFVEKLTGNTGVWQSTWVENNELEKYRELGFKFHELYESQERQKNEARLQLWINSLTINKESHL